MYSFKYNKRMAEYRKCTIINFIYTYYINSHAIVITTRVIKRHQE